MYKEYAHTHSHFLCNTDTNTRADTSYIMCLQGVVTWSEIMGLIQSKMWPTTNFIIIFSKHNNPNYTIIHMHISYYNINPN